jgi:putative membrane protein
MLRALPDLWRRRLVAWVHRRAWRTTWNWLGGAAVAVVLQLLLMWAWHTPRGLALALADDAVHIAMHGSLLAAALLFWGAVLRPLLGHGAAGVWVSLAALGATMKVNALVCITLMLQPAALYAVYGAGAGAWGLTAVGDDQLGWGLMMLGGSVSYLAAAGALLARGLETGAPGRGARTGVLLRREQASQSYTSDAAATARSGRG